MKGTKRILAVCAAILLAAGAVAAPVGAKISITLEDGWNPKVFNADNGSADVNLAAGAGVTVTGDEWATGENRGLACLNDGKTNPSSGDSQGWIINYDTVTAKKAEGKNVEFTLTFPAVTKVSLAYIIACFEGENMGYGMPARFQLIGTLADGSKTVLVDHTEFDFIPEPKYHGGYRFNFAPSDLKAITMSCIEPYAGCAGGKALPADINAAYWITEFMLFDDVAEHRQTKVDITQSANLAFRAAFSANYTGFYNDRPAADLNNGDVNSQFKGFIHFKSVMTGLAEATALQYNAQFNKSTTINDIKIFGRDSDNKGVPKKYKVILYDAAGAATTLYHSENAGTYPGVTVTAPGEGQPLELKFSRKTVARISIQAWDFTPSGDNDVLDWVTEIEMYNLGGATAITVNKASLALQTGDSDTLTATPNNSSTQTVVWSSSDTDIATVSGGVVTAVAAGSCNIIASLADDPTVRKVIPVTVADEIVAVSGVTLNKSTHTVVAKVPNSELEATVAPEDATIKTVKWTSSEETVATVDEDTGVITGVTLGTVTITATSTVDATKSASCEVTVSKKPVESIAVTPSSVTLDVRETTTLTAELSPNDATYNTYKWVSEDPEAVFVDELSGEVTALKGGVTVKVHAVSNDDETIKGTCVVTVTFVPVEELYLYLDDAFEEEAGDMTMRAGESVTLYPYVSPSDASDQELVWTSSDTAVATIEDGLLTAVKSGTATIRVEMKSDSNIYVEFELTVTGGGQVATGVALPALSALVAAAGAGLMTVSRRRRK